jgi:hypothetical protein
MKNIYLYNVSEKLIYPRTDANGDTFFSVFLPGICSITVNPEQISDATRMDDLTVIPGMKDIMLGRAGTVRKVSVSRCTGVDGDGNSIYEYNYARMPIDDIASRWAESYNEYRASKAAAQETSCGSGHDDYYDDDYYDSDYYDDPRDYLADEGYDPDYMDFLSDDEIWEQAMQNGWHY